MKSSINNLFYETDGYVYKWIVANTFNGTILVADQELMNAIKNPDGISEKLAERGKKFLYQELVEAGFVVDNEFNERQAVEARFSRAQKMRESMHLTIIPATGCNLRCTYCYESHRGTVMTDSTADEVIAYVKRHAGDLGDLDIAWFGGEPLLAKKSIRRISSALIKLSEEKQFRYGAIIVTNGTLLNVETVDLLVEAKIRSVQITLDGPPAVHNARRFYSKQKAPSFDDVLQGIRNCRGKLPVNIRVNVDRSNIGDYPDLIAFLHSEKLIGEGSGNSISLGLVKRWTDLVDTPEDQLMNGSEFEAKISELGELLKQLAGAKSDTGAVEKIGAGQKAAEEAGRLFRPAYPCAAVHDLNFVAMPDGGLKKCWIHATMANTAVGHVVTGANRDDLVAAKWQNYNPARDPECGSCALLPVCAGGCPYEMMERPGQKPEHCAFIRRRTERNVRAAAQPLLA
ncbi:MAG: radical SAM protein [Hyphomicrobiales bacterium]|nr:radical SAM protein [Hyphomicrobiales bacterium]